MNYENIKTVDDFEKLSDTDKMDLKYNHPLEYKKLFTNTSDTPAFDWRNHRQELNFYPSDIKTADDFERLSEAGKQYLKEEFPLQYKECLRVNR